MYHPYLRGKQFELILLRERAQLISDSDIRPIIEPVKDNLPLLKRTLDILVTKNVKFTLIINPSVGELVNRTNHLFTNYISKQLVNCDYCTLGFIVNATTDITKIINFIRTNDKYNYAIIHYGYSNGKYLASLCDGLQNVKKHIFIDRHSGQLYKSHFRKVGVDRVLVRDGFNARKNADYPPNEHYSDLHITYNSDMNMTGYGDFLIVGENYSEAGGPAYAVAIHITYLEPEDDDMYINHFVSDRTDSPTDPAGKFGEAVHKLALAMNRSKSKIYMSNACRDFIQFSKNGHYPGLGYVKKLSMQHHIELMADYLQR